MNTSMTSDSNVSQPPVVSPYPGLYNYYLLLPLSSAVTSTLPSNVTSSPHVVLSQDGGYWFVPQTNNNLLHNYTQPPLQVITDSCPPPSHHVKTRTIHAPFKPFRPWECEPRRDDTSVWSHLTYSPTPYYPGGEYIGQEEREVQSDMTEQMKEERGKETMGEEALEKSKKDTSTDDIGLIKVEAHVVSEEIVKKTEDEARVEDTLKEKVKCVGIEKMTTLEDSSISNSEENRTESGQEVFKKTKRERFEKSKKVEVQGEKKNIIGHKVDALVPKNESSLTSEKPRGETETATEVGGVWSQLRAGRRVQGQQLVPENVPFNEADFPALMSKMKIKK